MERTVQIQRNFYRDPSVKLERISILKEAQKTNTIQRELTALETSVFEDILAVDIDPKGSSVMFKSIQTGTQSSDTCFSFEDDDRADNSTPLWYAFVFIWEVGLGSIKIQTQTEERRNEFELESNSCVLLRVQPRASFVLELVSSPGEGAPAVEIFRLVQIRDNQLGSFNGKSFSSGSTKKIGEYTNQSLVELFSVHEWDHGQSTDAWPLRPRIGKEASSKSTTFALAQSKLSAFMNGALAEEVLDIREHYLKYPPKHVIGRDLKDSQKFTLSFQGYNFFDRESTVVRAFEKFIKQAYVKFLHVADLPRLPTFIHCWAIVLEKNDRINLHHHAEGHLAASSYISGTYCVTSTPTCTVYHSPFDNEETFEFPNFAGNLIMFPSYLPHSSTEYKGENFRITINFDIFRADARELLLERGKVMRLFDS